MAASMCMRVLSKNIKFHKYLSRSTANFSTNVFKPIPNSSGVLKAANSRGAIRITGKNRILPSTAKVLYSTEAHQDDIIDVEEEYHSIIKDTERSKGPADKHEFQAETRMLLDIVAKSLYSEREVFIRELISNSSDALEKLRYMQMTGVDVVDKDTPLEIHIKVDEEKKTFTIQDTGVGMTKEEMIDNLGTIAKSGTKAFLEQLKDSGSNNNLIGQFGVGFYSAFMVADKVDVFSQSSKEGAQGYKWTSDGYGNYEIAEAENVQRGTKIVMHLKGDSYDYSKEDIIKEVIKKYSNFVGVPIYVNGKKANVLEAVWMKEPKQVSEDMHEEFFRFIANAYDKPRYTLHYKTDAPLNIRALFYVPEYKPTLFDMSRDVDVGITLYSKRVMILNKATNVLPRWLRFVKGVVDSEDIPLNLSRELLQNSALIRKLSSVLTNRVLKFFLDQAKKDPVKYLKFYNDYGLFFREAIVSEPEQQIREDVSKLLRFESSSLPEGEVTGLDDYASRMAAGERNIYYLAAPSRELAMTSPYFEAMQEKNKEVLFCYESYDELVLMNLSQFNNKNLRSVENEVQEDKADTNTVDSNNEDSLSQDEANSLLDWLKITLGNKVQQAKVTQRLVSHPCIITVLEMGSARHFLRTTFAGKSEEEKYRLLQPTLEINPCHPVIKKLYTLKESDPLLAKLVAEQVYDNAMIAAGLVDDPRSMLGRLNEILSKTLEKH